MLFDCGGFVSGDFFKTIQDSLPDFLEIHGFCSLRYEIYTTFGVYNDINRGVLPMSCFSLVARNKLGSFCLTQMSADTWTGNQGGNVYVLRFLEAGRAHLTIGSEPIGVAAWDLTCPAFRLPDDLCTLVEPAGLRIRFCCGGAC